MLHRRDLLHAALAAGGVSLLGAGGEASDDAPRPCPGIVDTNVSLFQWPFRRLPLDETDALVKKLRCLGISEAWAGSFEGLLHRDVAGVNDRLIRTCAHNAELVPIGSVNPTLPAWEEDLERCLGESGMPAVRLHPGYHGYTLADPRFLELLKRAGSAGKLVQLAAAMEDPRTQHPMLTVPDVDLTPLPDLLRANSLTVTVQILNARPRGDLLDKLAATPGILFDTARVEGTDGIASLLRVVPQARILLGTHAPFLIPEAALIRLAESELADDVLDSVARTNALAVRKAGP